MTSLFFKWDRDLDLKAPWALFILGLLNKLWGGYSWRWLYQIYFFERKVILGLSHEDDV